MIDFYVYMSMLYWINLSLIKLFQSRVEIKF